MVKVHFSLIKHRFCQAVLPAKWSRGTTKYICVQLCRCGPTVEGRQRWAESLLTLLFVLCEVALTVWGQECYQLHFHKLGTSCEAFSALYFHRCDPFGKPQWQKNGICFWSLSSLKQAHFGSSRIFSPFLHIQKNILFDMTFLIYYNFWNWNLIKPHIKI